MAQESLRSDQFTVWVREKKIGFLRERALLWRVKHAKRMGEDPKRQIATAGHLVVVKRKDALGTLGPAILEVLFNENPLDELVTALREASTEMVNID
uniref:Bm11292 n=1 Tax=Brugia malayi TaxID=6279 RepID=A0A1P6BIK3_BRUMA|nr:Bm11292 [Brugia malayi]